MGEYWNQFLNWLNVVGSRMAYQDYPGQRIAPRAEDRYANSEPFEQTIPGFPISHKVQGVRQVQDKGGAFGSVFSHQQRPAEIFSYVAEPGDTVIEERPESALKWGLIDYYYPRKASTKNPKGDTYKILSKRLRTAKKLAKPAQ